MFQEKKHHQTWENNIKSSTSEKTRRTRWYITVKENGMFAEQETHQMQQTSGQTAGRSLHRSGLVDWQVD